MLELDATKIKGNKHHCTRWDVWATLTTRCGDYIDSFYAGEITAEPNKGGFSVAIIDNDKCVNVKHAASLRDGLKVLEKYHG